ncbi:MAG TPA: hypothetical protein VFE16_11285 [Candidatus Cybelea sp.]|jgi:hypothetical protein|nr:hypothetical protein [Candidatus Cybelea sp.]
MLRATIATIVPLFLALSPPLPASFAAPKGWVSKAPPANSPVDFIWLAPRFGVDGDGENLTVMSHPAVAGATLDAEVRRTIAELSADRRIVDSRSAPTCHGLQAGWMFDARVSLPNGKAVSQIYHVTIVDGRAYAFIFTHAAGARVDQAIADSMQSICPGKKSAS